MKKEIYMPVPLFLNLEVSNLGNVRRVLDDGTYKQVAVCMASNNEYKSVTFTYMGKHVTKRVHHLIMMAFIGYDNYNRLKKNFIVRFIDKDNLNCCFDNLQFASRSLVYQLCERPSTYTVSLLATDLNKGTFEQFDSIISASLHYGISRTTMRRYTMNNELFHHKPSGVTFKRI